MFFSILKCYFKKLKFVVVCVVFVFFVDIFILCFVRNCCIFFNIFLVLFFGFRKNIMLLVYFRDGCIFFILFNVILVSSGEIILFWGVFCFGNLGDIFVFKYFYNFFFICWGVMILDIIVLWLILLKYFLIFSLIIFLFRLFLFFCKCVKMYFCVLCVFLLGLKL